MVSISFDSYCRAFLLVSHSHMAVMPSSNEIVIRGREWKEGILAVVKHR